MLKLFLVISLCPAVTGLRHGLGAASPREPNVPDLWFTQKLDHFNLSDDRTWRQRYQVNDSMAHPGGPVFLMIGGEGPMSTSWIEEGHWIEMAGHFGAKCIQLEHRFYGKSQPLPDLSLENLYYLSSRQALEDLAAFVFYQRRHGEQWIVFGGSYPGSLAAWARLKYPHLIDGAISASGPVLAQLDFASSDEVVCGVVEKTSKQCATVLKAAFSSVSKLSQTVAGFKNLTTQLGICHLDYTALNISTVSALLVDTIEGSVQYTYDNRKKDAPNIDVACKQLLSMNASTPLGKFAQYIGLDPKQCTPMTYENDIAQLKNIASDNAARSWVWQTCTEFGYYDTTDSPNQWFGSEQPLSYFLKTCQDAYPGYKFDKETMQRRINATNAEYGGQSPVVSRVVFVNGMLDPWHMLSVLQSPGGHEVYVFKVKDGAHCCTMYPTSVHDSAALTRAKLDISKVLAHWVVKPTAAVVN